MLQKIRILSLSLCFVAPSVFASTPSLFPQAPSIAARAYILNDFYSGQTLAADAPDTRIEPASLTKLMTAYLTFQALRENRLTLDQKLTVSQRGWKTEGSRMFLDPRVPATVEELIHGMIIQSGNDACVTLAEAIAGSEESFAEQMTVAARKLGMSGTQFKNATGLPAEGHFTTVRDLGVLASALIREFPDFYPIYSKKEYRYNNITQPNRNLLLYRDPSVDGMKTGFTESAGYNLVASAHRPNRRVISIVVGTTSPQARAAESARLLHFGLQTFETPRLYTPKKVISELPVFKGDAAKVAIGVEHDVYVSVPKGSARKLQVQMSTHKPLIAPVKLGQSVGKLTVSLEGQTLMEYPLVAKAAVGEAGFFGRIIDSIKLLGQ